MKLKYVELNMDKIITDYENLLNRFSISDLDEQIKIIDDINIIREDFFSMYWLSYINYLLDVNSEYWNTQEAFFAKNDPIINNLRLKYYDVLNKSPYKEELNKIIGEKVFLIAEAEVRLMSDEINSDLQKEKELANAYKKVFASAKVNFDGQELSLTQLGKYVLSDDRNVRIKASDVRFEFMRKVENEIDGILDELIKARTNIAKTLGFDSYTDISYIKMKRLGYGKEDVETFRSEVLKHIVPLVQKMKVEQKEELGVEELMYYDEPILFKGGNATPKGDTKWIIKQALKMFEDISPKLHELFKKMVDEELIDLDSRQGKSGGGIATYIPNYKVPVFISNFNGTSHDINVLMHEFGHAFQLYSSKDLKYYENWWPTFDACEIHSTSMELLTLPYMHMFFKEDSGKYKHEELFSLLDVMCYICVVDEFQHVIYDEPNLTKEKRKLKWREIEEKYMPWLNFGDNDYLMRGNMWHKQSHIFSNPFYYIDYALANSVALQFYYMSLDDSEGTWDKYIHFCSLGGSYSFVDSVLKAGLKSPFEKDVLKILVEKLDK